MCSSDLCERWVQAGEVAVGEVEQMVERQALGEFAELVAFRRADKAVEALPDVALSRLFGDFLEQRLLALPRLFVAGEQGTLGAELFAEGAALSVELGEVVGQVNGLSVYELGDYAFGRPTRITARTYVGTKGVIDIQREVELAGNIHSKGVMTLAGFLAGKFAGMQPFALSATLTFEQTYSEIEGDSAAVAELTAVLSSLADLPVRQSLAVTGSVNQLGEIQPIGGVNEKIEGFFESCKRRGLTGTQGVIIPARNTKHLALNREVVAAVEEGKFAVYGVDHVEQALELLIGVPAGERGPEGTFPPESIYGRTAARLEEMAQIVANWGEGEEEPEKITG